MGGDEAAEWLRDVRKLGELHLICLSNSGRTAEVVELAQALRTKSGWQCASLTALTTNPDSPLAEAAQFTFPLRSGPELAVAATKSVVEQSLLLQSVILNLADQWITPTRLRGVADECGAILTAPVQATTVAALANAGTIYFAGDPGVTGELALKSSEIIGVRGVSLPGTSVIHGYEQNMEAGDVVMLVSFPSQRVRKVLEITQPIGVEVAAINRSVLGGVPTEVVRCDPLFQPYGELLKGWALLASVGAATNQDVDSPSRARKIGNEIESKR